MSELEEIARMWQHLLIDAMFAENYHLAYQIECDSISRNPVVERLLPSLLHIKAVTLLDHALKTWCDKNGHEIPKRPYGTDLYGRISYLVETGPLAQHSSLQTIRGTRNKLAHELDSAIDWSHLNGDIKAIHGALKELGLVGDFPEWDIRAKRSAGQSPKIENAITSFDYEVLISEGPKNIAALTWSSHIMKREA